MPLPKSSKRGEKMSGDPWPPQPPTPSRDPDTSDGDSIGEDRGLALLKQLEHILESDPLINELGFAHPTQLAELNAQPRMASSSNTTQAKGGIMDESIPELGVRLYDETVFWNNDHKLAISTAELPQLYSAVLRVFSNSIRKYRTSPDHDQFLQNELLRHSKALLLLSCDFGSAWNSRKLVILSNPSLLLFMGELQLSALVLSYSAKSETSWSHRRWAIKNIAQIPGNLQQLTEIMGQESELVETIAEKSKMNYRAWNHRCWLVLYMTRSQVLDELNKSRKWAELHVADNCCFHFRRRLMLKMLEDKFVEQYGDAGHSVKSDVYTLWEDEFTWNCLLIQRYVGREALWVHRRFLSKFWLINFVKNHHYILASSEDRLVELDVAIFLQKELQLLISCFNTTYDGFEDDQIQMEQATSYFFWTLKQIPPSRRSGLREKLGELAELKALWRTFCPLKILLWKDQLAGSPWEDLLRTSFSGPATSSLVGVRS